MNGSVSTSLSMSTKKQEERHLKILKELMQKEENKVCFDCAKRTPVFVNITATTFICTSCSGIVREFSHRVKSVSASIFTPAEIQSLQKGGNSYARRTWLATWNPETYPQPDANDTFGIREFMRVKYVQKRFYKEIMESFTSGSPPQMPGSPIQVSPPPKRDLFSMSTSQKDLLTLDSEPMKPSSSASEIVFGGFVSSPSKAAAVQPPLDLRHFAPSLLDNKPLPTKPDEFAYFSGFVSAPPVQPATVPTMINSMTTTRSSMPVMNAGTFPANPTEKTILPCVSMNPIVPSQLGGFKPLNASSVDGLPSFGTQTPNPLGATSITPAADDPYAALRGFDSSVAKHSSLFDLGSYQPPKNTGGFAVVQPIKLSDLTPPASNPGTPKVPNRNGGHQFATFSAPPVLQPQRKQSIPVLDILNDLDPLRKS